MVRTIKVFYYVSCYSNDYTQHTLEMEFNALNGSLSLLQLVKVNGKFCSSGKQEINHCCTKRSSI